MRYSFIVLLAVLASLLALPTAAQPDLTSITGPPDADWRTVTTAHFRVHYPADSETWALHAAARLEAVRARVAAAVGYTPEVVTDVVVSDPVAQPNGMALPFLGWPRMILWTSPPGPDSAIGHYRDWAELLLVHEDVHLVHLLRPSRNPLRRAAARLVPVGPVTNAPRWVSEGYATVLEGRLTASGRPNGDVRAAVLRRWAQAGKLPTYDRLASDDDSFLGMSMAYLAGSAYLQWLEERAADDGREDALRDLWARLTARQRRDFDTAFRGVFGDTPRDLWDRFGAELTWRAMEIERRIETDGDGGYREGETWLDLAWNTGAPAVSPDGERLALVLRHQERPPELVVYATEVDREALEARETRAAELTERDPQDVPAADPGPPPRKRLYTLATRDGAPPAEPRWLPGGEALLLVRYLPDERGLIHPDLFRWTPGSGRLERVTQQADLRQPDPAPDGTWAVAVRRRHGLSQLVRVELADGEIRPLTEPSLTTVVDGPRVAPDGARVAYARHRADEDAWALVVRRLDDGDERALPLPDGTTAATPAWGRDGTLYAVVGGGGFLDVFSFRPDGAGGWTVTPVTRSRGAALAPEPAPPVGDEPAGLFFLSLEPDGLDLRRLPVDEQPPVTVELPATLAPAVRPPAPQPQPPFEAAELPPSEPYGLGPRQERLLLAGGALGAGAWSSELGVRSGDLLGRLDLVATGAWGGDGGAEGGALAVAWRNLPVDVELHLFSLRERPSRQDHVPAGLGTRLDLERAGAEVAARWVRRGVRAGGGIYAGNTDGPEGGEDRDEGVLFAEAAWQPRWQRGRWHLFAELAGRWDQGRSEVAGDRDVTWHRWRAGGRLRLAWDEPALTLAWERGAVDGDAPAGQLFQVGGLPSSLLPSTLRAPRVAVPAVPAGTLLGDRLESQRADLTGVLPLPLFWARHRVSDGGDWLELAGVEWRGTLGPAPLLRLPEVHLALGIAEILEGAREGEREGWLALTFRP